MYTVDIFNHYQVHWQCSIISLCLCPSRLHILDFKDNANCWRCQGSWWTLEGTFDWNKSIKEAQVPIWIPVLEGRRYPECIPLWLAHTSVMIQEDRTFRTGEQAWITKCQMQYMKCHFVNETQYHLTSEKFQCGFIPQACLKERLTQDLF